MESTYSADELLQYRSLSTLSVVALVLGLLSPLVFVSPLLMIFPFAAAGAACLALSKIHAADGNLSGARLARCGLALAVIFGVGSAARAKIGELLYQRQTDAVVEPWLNLLCGGRYDDALDLMSPEAVAKLRAETSALGDVKFFERRLTARELAKDATASALRQLMTSEKMPEVIVTTFDQVDLQVAATSKAKQADCIYAATNNRGASLRVGIKLIWISGSDLAPSWRIDKWQLVDH